MKDTQLLWLDETGRWHKALFRVPQGHALLEYKNGEEWTDGWEGMTSTDFEPEGEEGEDDYWAQELQSDLYGFLFGGCGAALHKEKNPEIEAIIETLHTRYED